MLVFPTFLHFFGALTVIQVVSLADMNRKGKDVRKQ
jgi:hypothetical protein